MIVVNGKTLARLAAVQLIFQYEMRGRLHSLEQLIEQITNYYSALKFGDPFYQTKAKLNVALFNLLVSIAKQKEYELNAIVADLLPGDADLLKASIIKVGIVEISWVRQAPHVVVVSEYSNIASSLSINPAAVNSILDRIKA